MCTYILHVYTYIIYIWCSVNKYIIYIYMHIPVNWQLDHWLLFGLLAYINWLLVARISVRFSILYRSKQIIATLRHPITSL